MGTILSSGYLQSVLGTALQSIGLTTKKAGKSPENGSLSSVGQQPDGGQLSPFAGLVVTLQQLQQSNPTAFGKATQQIAVNLQGAAQAAQAGGNQTAAKQLSQLATSFSTASQTGQLPGVQDLAQGIFGGLHNQSVTGAGDSNANSGDAPGASANQALSQLLSALQPAGTANGSFNPLTIINQTLSSAGITATV